MSQSAITLVGSALAVDSRAEILRTIRANRTCTTLEIARQVDLAPSTTSHHLGVLIDAGLITVEHGGRFRHFRLASAEVEDLLHRIEILEMPSG